MLYEKYCVKKVYQPKRGLQKNKNPWPVKPEIKIIIENHMLSKSK